MVDLTKVFGGSFDTVDHPPEKPKDNIDPYSDFLNQLQAFGLKVDSLVEGKMTRCKMVDGKRGKKSGWYIFYPDHDISAGAFGDWRDPYNTQNWCSKSEREMTTSEISAYRARVALLKEQAEKERAEQAEKAAEEVTELLSSLPYAEPDQPYLKRKGVGSYGIYYSEKEKALIIPIRNVNGSARSVQRIYNNGGKYFHSGGEIPGNFHLIGSTLTEPTYIVEGYATGATIHEATGKAVVVACN
jgi:putative DNA primase/helicase